MSTAVNVIPFSPRVDREHEARVAANERLRIARELHDVIASSFASITIHAGVALRLLGDAPAPLAGALHAIDLASKEALAELHTVLGLLREGDGALPALAPGLDRLDELEPLMAVGGVEASFAVTGRERQLPPAVDRAAFRIVQEAISNVVRHNGPAPTIVTLHYEADRLDVTVENAAGPGPTTRGAPGYGIVGMRERVAALGGRFEAGPRRDGGFAVRASFPLVAHA